MRSQDNSYPVNTYNNDNARSQEWEPPFLYMHVGPTPLEEPLKSAVSSPYATLTSLVKQMEKLAQECKTAIAREHANTLAAKLARMYTQRRKVAKTQPRRKEKYVRQPGCEQSMTKEEETWMCDSGSSYHITLQEEDYDPGTAEHCDITLKLGDNKQMHVTKMGKCTRMTREGRKIILVQVLLAPIDCPTRILATGKLTKGGQSIFLQDEKEVRLKEKSTGDLIMKGELNTLNNTADIYLLKAVPTLLPPTAPQFPKAETRRPVRLKKFSLTTEQTSVPNTAKTTMLSCADKEEWFDDKKDKNNPIVEKAHKGQEELVSLPMSCGHLSYHVERQQLDVVKENVVCQKDSPSPNNPKETHVLSPAVAYGIPHIKTKEEQLLEHSNKRKGHTHSGTTGRKEKLSVSTQVQQKKFKKPFRKRCLNNNRMFSRRCIGKQRSPTTNLERKSAVSTNEELEGVNLCRKTDRHFIG
jgi:hypothetical protein